MSNNKEIWGDIVMDDGYVQTPQLLRKNRTKLGLSNNEFMVLIDYIDEWHYTKTTNPYPKLMEYSGLCKRSLQKIIESMENKGLLKREIVSVPGVGDTGIKLDLSPLLNKLRSLGDETVVKTVTPPHDETVTPSTKNKYKDKEKEINKEKESRLGKDFKKFWEEYPRKKARAMQRKPGSRLSLPRNLLKKSSARLLCLSVLSSGYEKANSLFPTLLHG